MVPGNETYNDDQEDVQETAPAQAPAVNEGEATTAVEPAHVPIHGSPGGVYRIDDDGKRVRVQD